MFIYLITNKINGKQYVGQTSKSIKQRWSVHINAKNNTFIYRAIKKYGKENFHIDQIDTADSTNELDWKEIYYIKILNTLAPNGYNLTTGGESRIGSSNPFYGKKTTEENKRKTSERTKKLFKDPKNHPMYGRDRSGCKNPMYGKNQIEEAKEKIRQKSKQNSLGEKNPMYGRTGELAGFYGKIHTEETKRKMSEASKGKPKPKEQIEKAVRTIANKSPIDKRKAILKCLIKRHPQSPSRGMWITELEGLI